MTGRRFASDIAGAAGLIAVTTLLARLVGLRPDPGLHRGGARRWRRRHLPERQRHPERAVRDRRGRHPRRGRRPAHRPPARGGGARPGRPHGIRAAVVGPARAGAAGAAALAARRADLVVARRAQRPAGRTRSATTLLRIFAVQVPLYGAGHHPHRPAPGPPALPRGRAGTAGVVDRRAGVLPLVRLDRRRPGRPVAGAATRRSGCSAGAPRSGSSCCRCRSSCRRCAPGWRWRPALRMPRDDARRIGALAGAGVIALLAQQAAVLVTTAAVQAVRRPRARSPSTPTRRPSTCCPTPCSPCRSPRAPSRRSPRARAPGRTSRGTLRALAAGGARADRRCRSGVLIAAAPAVGAFFSLLDARRGDGATSTAALAALPGDAHRLRARAWSGSALTALLTRALYVRGRPDRCRARRGARAGPSPALLPLVVLAGRAEPGGDPALAGHRARRSA